MINIKRGMELINAGYGLVSGSQIGMSSFFWSSSEDGSRDAWRSNFYSDYGLDGYHNYKTNSYEVRPVLEF